jgi:predicted metalloprotease with PDZ domain
MRALGVVIIGLIAIATAAAAKPNPAVVDYRLTPEMKDGALAALDVDMRLSAGRTGVTTIDLPDRGRGSSGRWKFISDIEVRGAAAREDGAAKRVLTSKPGAAIEVSYRVHSAYATDPSGEDGGVYKGAVVRPAWFAGLGLFVFATPEGRDDSQATFRWGPTPKGWTVGSDLDPVPGRGPMTVANVANSTLLGGTDVRLYSRPAKGGAIRVAIRGEWGFPEQRLVDDINTIVRVQRRFWSSAGGPYFVSVIPLTTSPNLMSFTGNGLYDGFSLDGTSNVDEAGLRRVLAHEHTHNWIPFQQGALPAGGAQAGAYWYSEGFTDFYADRTLLRSGLWAPRDFTAHFNEVLRNYDISPVQRAPNSRIVADFWKNPDVSALTYQRGYLLAFIWDEEMARATHDLADLDQVMFAMRDRYRAAPATAKPDLIANFETTARDLTGVDVRSDVERFAIQGDAIGLPRDLFGACATIAAVTVPAFDLGFDAPASAAKGVFTGVDPSGPAYAAGLRNGMKRIARGGGEPGDSRIEIIYRVLDQSGVERTIRYQPQGKTNVTFQQASLTPEAAKTSCAALLSGDVSRPRPITRKRIGSSGYDRARP